MGSFAGEGFMAWVMRDALFLEEVRGAIEENVKGERSQVINIEVGDMT